jgi:hypothetical protein
MRLIPSRNHARMRAWAYRALIRVVRWTDRTLGINGLFWMLLPWTLWEILRRRRDFRYFVQLRNRLPGPFWKGTGALAHFLRMISRWQGALCVCLLYDRLRTPRWSRRCRIEGTPPDRLPEWGRRPVVLAFLHSDGYATLRYWLRSRGIPSATLVAGFPPPLNQEAFLQIRATADSAYGLEGYPHTFTPEQLKALIQALTPGRVLAIALDGIATAGPLVEHPLEGRSIRLKDGAFRIAARCTAILMPVTIEQTGFLTFTFTFGEPVPDAWLNDADPRRAHEGLLAQLWNLPRRKPCSLTWSTLESLAPGENRSRTSWP